MRIKKLKKTFALLMLIIKFLTNDYNFIKSYNLKKIECLIYWYEKWTSKFTISNVTYL